MSRATDTPSTGTSSPRTGTATTTAGAAMPAGKIVCPFCGSVNERPAHDYDSAACPRCTMTDSPATRQATRARLGPWFVRQNRNPAAPGMKFETLMALVKRGQVTAQSVVRGPTTNQFWRFAAQVKGLSREFGVCYNCSTAIEKTATICPQCNRMQEPPSNPDVLLENAPTASAATATPAAPSTSVAPTATSASAASVVHREIRTPAPTSQPASAPAPSRAPAAVAVAAVDEVSKAVLGPAATAPKRGPSSRREPQPASREEPPRSSRTDLLAPSPARSRRISPRQRSVEDGILSAEDLATAFQLDFKPDQRRPGGVRRALIVTVLLAISAGAVLLILNQDYREQARVWMSQKTTALRGMITGRAATRPPAPTETAPVAPPVEEPRSTVAAAVPATQPSPTAIAPPAPPAEQKPLVAKAAPETKPATPETRPVEPSPAPSAQITIAPAPRVEPAPRTPTNAAGTKDTSTAKVTAAPVDAAAASRQAMTLWGQALDAEARRDYAKAVENYEAIKKLPRSAWPAGLEIRLELAKKRVK